MRVFRDARALKSTQRSSPLTQKTWQKRNARINQLNPLFPSIRFGQESQVRLSVNPCNIFGFSPILLREECPKKKGRELHCKSVISCSGCEHSAKQPRIRQLKEQQSRNRMSRSSNEANQLTTLRILQQLSKEGAKWVELDPGKSWRVFRTLDAPLPSLSPSHNFPVASPIGLGPFWEWRQEEKRQNRQSGFCFCPDHKYLDRFI